MKKKTLEEVKILLKDRNYQLLDKEYFHNKQKLNLICKNDHQIKKTLNDVLNGKGCAVCFGNRPNSIEDIQDFLDKTNFLFISYEEKKVTLKCNKNHIFSASFNNLKSRHSGCPYCYGNKKKTVEEIRSKINSLGFTLLSENYINAHSNLEFECKNGHNFKKTMHNFNKSPTCPSCEESTKETLCRNIFEEKFNAKFPKIRPIWMRSPITNALLELDGFNEDLKIAFEYDGRMHFEPMFGEDALRDIQIRDSIKEKLCQKFGIKLIRISYKVRDIKSFIDKAL